MINDAEIERDVAAFCTMTFEQRQAALMRMRIYMKIYFESALSALPYMEGERQDAAKALHDQSERNWRYWLLVHERCQMALGQDLPQVIIR